jgi:hypothetical protein
MHMQRALEISWRSPGDPLGNPFSPPGIPRLPDDCWSLSSGLLGPGRRMLIAQRRANAHPVSGGRLENRARGSPAAAGMTIEPVSSVVPQGWDGAGAPGGPPKAIARRGERRTGAAQRRRLIKYGSIRQRSAWCAWCGLPDLPDTAYQIRRPFRSGRIWRQRGTQCGSVTWARHSYRRVALAD